MIQQLNLYLRKQKKQNLEINQIESIKKIPVDFKDDWKDSVIFKNAMKKEAVKRNMPYEKYKKYELKSDEEEMKTKHFVFK